MGASCCFKQSGQKRHHFEKLALEQSAAGSMLQLDEEPVHGPNANVMINFMSQFDWVIVPRYLVKDCSTGFWEGVFGLDLQVKSCTMSQPDCLPSVGGPRQIT